MGHDALRQILITGSVHEISDKQLFSASRRPHVYHAQTNRRFQESHVAYSAGFKHNW